MIINFLNAGIMFDVAHSRKEKDFCFKTQELENKKAPNALVELQGRG